jgi:hypothetical protein
VNVIVHIITREGSQKRIPQRVTRIRTHFTLSRSLLTLIRYLLTRESKAHTPQIPALPFRVDSDQVPCPEREREKGVGGGGGGGGCGGDGGGGGGWVR